MSNKGNGDRGSKEVRLIDKLKHENAKLKKEVSQLRKQMSRIDLDRYTNVRDIIQKYDKLEKEEDQKSATESLKKVWQCHECKTGFLRMLTFERADGIYYFRKCSECSHRTKMQKLTPTTKVGPKAEE